MFTVCPKCTLTLVVTTVDLRAGQGYVRCGRCANVFNALIALREGDPNGSAADTANRRLQETAPINPAVGAGVATIWVASALAVGTDVETGAIPSVAVLLAASGVDCVGLSSWFVCCIAWASAASCGSICGCAVLATAGAAAAGSGG